MRRTGKVDPQVGIDLKSIREMTMVEARGDRWFLGAGLSLGALQDVVYSRFFGDCLEGIADHTVRNRLTLGGNLCGRLPYREAALPLLLADADALLYGPAGARRIPLRRLAPQGRLKLGAGEFLTGIEVDPNHWEERIFRMRRTGAGPVAYPLLHLLLRPAGRRWEIALSGLFPVPHYQDVPSPAGLPIREWARETAALFAGRYREDAAGSAPYRRALLENALAEGAAVFDREGL